MNRQGSMPRCRPILARFDHRLPQTLPIDKEMDRLTSRTADLNRLDSGKHIP